MRTYVYAIGVILLVLITGCKNGLPPQPVSNGEPPFGATAYEQNLDAMTSYAASSMGGELRRQVEQAALAGNSFSVQSFDGIGRADEIRAWWHTNSTQVEAVISTPSL